MNNLLPDNLLRRRVAGRLGRHLRVQHGLVHTNRAHLGVQHALAPRRLVVALGVDLEHK